MPSFTSSQIAPNTYEGVFFEASTKTTMRDLLKLGNMFANDGWVYGTNSRYLTMADVVYGMARKSLRTHPVEDLVGDYFRDDGRNWLFCRFGHRHQLFRIGICARTLGRLRTLSRALRHGHSVW